MKFFTALSYSKCKDRGKNTKCLGHAFLYMHPFRHGVIHTLKSEISEGGITLQELGGEPRFCGMKKMAEKECRVVVRVMEEMVKKTEFKLGFKVESAMC